LREFLHVDDLTDALSFLMNNYSNGGIVNVGSGQEVSISYLAHLVSDVVGYQGELTFDRSKPDGTPRKLLDVGKLGTLGWKAQLELSAGIYDTYHWFEASQTHSRA
jgi:GDP-L-fucose synthase